MIDILALIQGRQLSPEEAIDIFLQHNEDFHNGKTKTQWYEEFNLSKYEASAKLQGATFEDLVHLRYEGWPSICCNCSQPIDYKSFGWMIRHSQDGKLCLEHINCSSDPST
jgi:hypothetical protein